MTRSETFGQEGFLGCKRTRLMHSFICFQATGRVDSRDFEGRTPTIHETVGFGACGSPKRTRLKQNPQVLFRN